MNAVIIYSKHVLIKINKKEKIDETKRNNDKNRLHSLLKYTQKGEIVNHLQLAKHNCRNKYMCPIS